LATLAHLTDLNPEDATGSDDATKGIVVIYDIFGYFDQTIQGADILATSDDYHKYKVVIPDWYSCIPHPRSRPYPQALTISIQV